MDREIQAPIDKKTAKELRAGDYVKITGTIYTARDAAHKRMAEALDKGEKLPVDIHGETIYYMGPTPAREGRAIGSAGPTTASRMDKYAPRLLDMGMVGMIGKGNGQKKWRMQLCEMKVYILRRWAVQAPFCQNVYFLRRLLHMRIWEQRRSGNLR